MNDRLASAPLGDSGGALMRLGLLIPALSDWWLLADCGLIYA
jgi:hypothetical protein